MYAIGHMLDRFKRAGVGSNSILECNILFETENRASPTVVAQHTMKMAKTGVDQFDQSNPSFVENVASLSSAAAKMMP
jgi:hypothetical protein